MKNPEFIKLLEETNRFLIEETTKRLDDLLKLKKYSDLELMNLHLSMAATFFGSVLNLFAICTQGQADIDRLLNEITAEIKKRIKFNSPDVDGYFNA